MCGIVGYWRRRGKAEAEICERMALQIKHRGPDDSGVWLDEKEGLGLAHRRLSVIDLSSAGQQPMSSPCGRFTLVYNGEIYNHLEIRMNLEQKGRDFDWRGYSDTETLLAALSFWGVEVTLKLLNGMFAFAFWDRAERLLYLARDRMGEKPLYYGRSGRSFLFGSELKAFTVHPDWHGEVDRDALTLYLRYNYVPCPWSIYRGINKLPPAHYVVIGRNGTAVSEPKCYWDLSQIAEKGSVETQDDPVALTDKLDLLLRNAVSRRMVADVPLGAFLSGGYDSSTIVALMQAQSSRPVKTFSIGFHERGYNEAPYSKAVAEHLGTDHTELYVTQEEARSVIPHLPRIWDEPFSDSSQIPTYLVSKLTRRHVTVSLSGDGGDELFCGYNRYAFGYQLWKMTRFVPKHLCGILAAMLKKVPMSVLDSAMQCLPPRMRYQEFGDRLLKFAEVISCKDEDDFYRTLISHWKVPARLVLNGHEPVTLASDPNLQPALPGFREFMMYLDAMTYLPDDILVKVDRASMAVGLEARVPMLDHRVVEFAWQIPTKFKYRFGMAKWILRQVLYRYVPKEIMDRTKMGFAIPIDHWLRGPLREWAEEMLAEKRLREEGFFDPKTILRMWHEHISNKRRWHNHLWDILMFQAWKGQTR